MIVALHAFGSIRNIATPYRILDRRRGTFDFDAGESIHTENSYKYTPDELRQLAWDAGWMGEKVWLDDKGYFSVHLLKART